MKFIKNLLLILLLSLFVSTSVNAYTFNRDMRLGSSGPDVIELQNYLITTGLLNWPVGVDKGYFGNVTRNAVMSWQAANGIVPASGIVGRISRAKLNSTPATTTAPITASTTGVWFYDGVDYSGQSYFYNNLTQVNSLGSDRNDKISSIKIQGNYQVDAYQHINYGGTLKNIKTSIPDLRSISFDNMISSFKIVASSTAPVATTTATSTCDTLIHPQAPFLIKTSFETIAGQPEVETLRKHMITKGVLSNTKSINSCGNAIFDTDLINAVKKYKFNNTIFESSSLFDPVTFSLINSELGYPDKVHPDVPAGYSFCAVESKNCTFTGNKDVIYGSNNTWTTARTNRTSPVACTNATFGDPLRNITKGCFVKNSATTTATTTPVSTPTASLLINGVKEFTMTSTSTLPTITWISTNGNNYSTVLNVNSATSCLIPSGTLWTSGGKTASGSYTLTVNDASLRKDCDVTFVYSVKNSNNQTATSSIVLKYRPGTVTTVATTTGVWFYDDINYSGQSYYYNNLTDLSFVGNTRNDKISSIKIQGNYQVDAYQHINYGGTLKNIKTSIPDLRSISFDNIISSFKIRAASSTN